MGSQFWWFYDVIAGAIILVCIFIWGRKGIMKSIFALTACFLAAAIAFGISSGAAKSMYDITVRSSNVKKLSKNIDENTFLYSYSAYLESLGYNIVVNNEKLDAIFAGDGDYTEKICRYVNSINGRKVEKNDDILRQKVRDGYAAVISDLVSESLKSKYAAATASRLISEKGNIDELLPLITDHDIQKGAAEYIADNYTSDAYHTLFRLGTFIGLFVILTFIIGAILRSYNNKEETVLDLGNHVVGGILGAVTGGVFIFVVAAAVRLWSVLGSNEMLFFNNDVVDKTYFFRFFYDLTTKM